MESNVTNLEYKNLKTITKTIKSSLVSLDEQKTSKTTHKKSGNVCLIKNYSKAKSSVINKKEFPQEDVWLKLDNAALIYPSAQNSNWNSVYRVSAYLNENINPEHLQRALESTCKRFPHINVAMRRGVFWYYFQQLKKYPKVQPEVSYPCEKFEMGLKNHLFRVVYFKNRISLETFHSLMDGTGAKAILSCLLGAYLTYSQKNFNASTMYYNHLDRSNEEEIEDSFMRYADLKEFASRKSEKTVQAQGPVDKRKLYIVSGEISVQNIKQQAKKYGATITEFVLAIYFKAMFKHIKTYGRPLVISVPCNLRGIFESQTLRNFSSWINVKIYKDLSLQEMINQIKKQMLQINPENMLKNINANVKPQKNWIVRIMPLFLKNIALKLSYNMFGEKKYTTVVSNLGKVELPENYQEYVKKCDFILGPAKFNKIDCALISVKDILTISFSSCLKERGIERDFFRLLSKENVNVKVTSNIE